MEKLKLYYVDLKLLYSYQTIQLHPLTLEQKSYHRRREKVGGV